MELKFDDNNFVMTGVTSRDVPLCRKAGFSFSGIEGKYFTPLPQVAVRLSKHADDFTRRIINRVMIEVKPWAHGIRAPKGLAAKPFQIEAIKWALSRNRSYLWADPGLGKTIMAALMMRALDDNSDGITRFAYVCPPFLVPNVQEELTKWTGWEKHNVLMVPDSMLTKDKTLGDLFGSHLRADHHVLFVDEAHRFKNDKAQRTKALFNEIFPLFDRVIFMSGTMMPNRPIELYPVLSKAAPEVIKHRNIYAYAKKYCAAFHDGHGLDMSGASNTVELGEKLREKFMYRLEKKLLGLPPRTEEIILLGDRLPKQLAELDRSILSRHSPKDLIEREIKKSLGKKDKDDLHLSTYRKELGIYKVKFALPFIKSVLEDTDEKIIVGVQHIEVMKKLISGLTKYCPLVIDGSIKTNSRLSVAKEFQANGKRRVILLNAKAGGIGFNLTKASRVIFVEYSYAPSENDQLLDRAHRIGTEHAVVGQYLVLKNSLDRPVMNTALTKRNVINLL